MGDKRERAGVDAESLRPRCGSGTCEGRVEVWVEERGAKVQLGESLSKMGAAPEQRWAVRRVPWWVGVPTIVPATGSVLGWEQPDISSAMGPEVVTARAVSQFCTSQWVLS